MRRLVVRPQAELEIAAAADWYKSQNPVAALEFTAAVERVLKVVQENPYQYQAIEGEIRRAIMLPFPYWVVYLVTGSDVVVVSCVHTSRDPNTWRERLP
jgi:plasmid stabilization system protein ParE